MLSDTVERDESEVNKRKRTSQEKINILLNRETEYKPTNTLFLLWIAYRFFQNDYESRPENTAYMHGFTMSFGRFFLIFIKRQVLIH